MSPVDYIEAVAKFPGSGLYADLKNGQQNPINIVLRNGAASDITLVSASASFHDVDRHWKLLRNASESKYGATVLASSNVSIPFSIYSDFAPKEHGLTVWADILDAGNAPHRVIAYNSTVNIVEPPASFFDPSLLFLYAILAGFAFFVGSFLYRTFVAPAPSSKTGGSNSKDGGKRKVVVPVTKQAAYPASVEPYEEEWIPASHLAARKRKTAGAASASSGGEELTSGGEGRKGGKKGKGRK